MSTVGLDDRATDGEPHSDPPGLGGKEWFEDTVGMCRIDSWSAIPDLDRDTVGMLCRLDENFPWPVGQSAHCLDAVHYQIQDDLLQLHAITEERRQIAGKIATQGGAVSGQVIVEEPGAFANDFIDIEAGSVGNALHEQGANPRNDGAGAGSVVDNLRNRLAQGLKISFLAA